MNHSNFVLLCQLLSGPRLPQQSRSSPAAFKSVSRKFGFLEGNNSQADVRYAELLEHFRTHTTQDGAYSQPVCAKRYLDLAIDAPYLLQQILATTASHLSSSRPAQRDAYKGQAVDLREAALLTYASTVRKVDDTNCVALLLFAGLLGVQTLFDAATTCEEDTSVFLSNVLLFIDVQRGARLIAHHSWPFLCQSELGPFLHSAETKLGVFRDQHGELDILQSLMEQSEMDEVSLKACQEATASLQWCFHVARTSKRKRSNIHDAFAWPASLRADFVSLLVIRAPPALVILAFYGGLLHQHRRIWFVGNTGQRLIECITALLGPTWTPWLTWPNQSLTSEAKI